MSYLSGLSAPTAAAMRARRPSVSPTARPTMTAARNWLSGQSRMGRFNLWPLTPQASPKEIAAFYGISHLAVDCMARRYGEDEMFPVLSVDP